MRAGKEKVEEVERRKESGEMGNEKGLVSQNLCFFLVKSQIFCVY